MIKQPWTPKSAFFSMYWLLSLSVGAVRARFAENSCKVFPELCRFPARRRLGGEPGAEGESMRLSMSVSVSWVWVWAWDWVWVKYILSIFSGLRGERGDFENDTMRETPLWRNCYDVKIMTAMVSTIWPWWWLLWKSNAKLMNTSAMWCVLPKISRAVDQGCEPSPEKSKQ